MLCIFASMGSACCVAARDRTISSESHCEVLQRNIRRSPTWSFRWDNRGRVAEEDMSINWFFDEGNRHSRSDINSGATIDTVNASDEISPFDSFGTVVWQKSPISEVNNGIFKKHTSDRPVLKGSTEVAELESPTVSDPSTTKRSLTLHPISPLSSQSRLHSAISTPSRWPHYSPGHQLSRQGSDNHVTELKSSNLLVSEEAAAFVLPGWSNELTRGSNGGSSDVWSVAPFPEIMAASHRERWSCDSEFFAFNQEKRSNGRISGSASASNSHYCGICLKSLSERSLWGGQKIITTNELAVVAVLICGHVYHAECLDTVTPEINKYDPACPICTFGEKQLLKLSERALKAEMEWKIRNRRRSRNRIVDGDLVFDRQKSCGNVGRGLEILSSPSTKSSLKKPFLRRHFSFGSKVSRPLPDNYSTRKKGFFWSRSTKE